MQYNAIYNMMLWCYDEIDDKNDDGADATHDEVDEKVKKRQKKTGTVTDNNRTQYYRL